MSVQAPDRGTRTNPRVIAATLGAAILAVAALITLALTMGGDPEARTMDSTQTVLDTINGDRVPCRPDGPTQMLTGFSGGHGGMYQSCGAIEARVYPSTRDRVDAQPSPAVMDYMGEDRTMVVGKNWIVFVPAPYAPDVQAALGGDIIPPG
jgi:hypothetical protein